ncbi:MAG: EamA family transporter [Clostridia bacterium]|nr:EamA family transporter [Clostridia bacterium]
MYYGLLSISVIMFGTTFLFSKKYNKEMGSGLDATLISTIIGSFVGLIVLFIINKIQFGFTPFTLLMASASAINGILFSFCSLKSLDKINLSLYSIFSMLGGMLIPFLHGIIFYGEPITVGKSICVIFIILALAITVEKDNRKGGFIYYAGVFIFNGMSGVISKIHQSSSFETTNSAVFSIWTAIVSIVISGILLLIFRKKAKKPSKMAIFYAAGNGILNKIANYLLLIALTVLPSTVQYPFVTGGTMIVSTFFSAVTGQKPSKKELISVTLSFIGILALVLL